MKQLFSFVLSILFTSLISAQVPQAFNYQGISRDLSGNPLPNQEIGVSISILQGSITGSAVYQETHSVTTSNTGLFTLKIGTGIVEDGIFSAINWGKDSYFLQLAIDEEGENNYQLIGTSELLSVPYALNAGRVGSFQSNGEFSVVSNENVNFPYEAELEQSTFAVWVSDVSVYDPNMLNLDGLNIYHRDPESHGDVCLKLTSKSIETFDTENLFHSSSQVILNAVSKGLDKADFTIQNEYSGPYNVKETFRIKHNGNVGIDNQNPASKLQVSNGDLYIDDINSGVIMKSPNGQCWRMTVSNSGQPVFNAITCPE
ncbi:MAG: hypothetical protein MI974_08440 [Chitinophagales bacterium]|nr:hypothetical protein [Chitinophagales bacterium]